MYKKTAFRVLRLLAVYRYRLLLSLLLALLLVASTLFVPILIGRAIDTFVAVGKVDFASLLPILQKIILTVLVTAAAQWCMNVLNNQVVYALVKDLREKAFAKIHRLNMRYLDEKQHGDILNRIINDVDQFSEGLLLGLSQFFTGVLTIVTTLVFMFMMSPMITLVVFTLTPLSMLAAAYIAKNSYQYFRAQSVNRALLSALSNEMIEGLPTIKNFGTEEDIARRFAKIDKDLEASSVQALFYSAAAMPSTRFVNAVIYMAVGVLGAVLVVKGSISVGRLSSFLSYAGTYTKPFNEISGVVTELQNSLACASRIFAFLDEEELPKDAEKASALEKVGGELSLQNLCFSYTKGQSFIENLSLDIRKGQKIAIVGPTGCGKTTLMNLLLRFYEADSGDIRIDGHSIYGLQRKSLHRAYGVVFQDTWLKNATIRDNIAMAKPDAGTEEITAAAKLAGADGFIRRLPAGYDTMITAGGENISAGERQLICIARIMLLLPPMLILDEATSSIDTRTELKISAAFDKLMENRTAFIVAHRLSTIREADLILVMKEGKIIERGTHESLLAAGGFYKDLYSSQFALYS